MLSSETDAPRVLDSKQWQPYADGGQSTDEIEIEFVSKTNVQGSDWIFMRIELPIPGRYQLLLAFVLRVRQPHPFSHPPNLPIDGKLRS